MPKTRTNKSIVGLTQKETAEDINAQLNWTMIDGKAVEKRVYKLQKRIYQASSRGDVKAVRRLQKTLIKSWSAKVLAVRRVSQDNQGKKTAGVDGVKSLTPKKRLTMVDKLKLGIKVKPTRRVGRENRLIEYVNTWKGAKRQNQCSLSFIRYADDFVVIHKDKSIIKECFNILMEWLKDMGLEISPSKTRMGRSPEMPERTAILLKRQKGKCAHCGLTFKFGDLMEHDHIKPLSLGGEKGIKNQQLLHRHCHDDKTRKDGSLTRNISKPTITWSKIEYKWINDMLVLVSQ